MTDLQFEKLLREIDRTNLNPSATVEQKMFVTLLKQMLEAYRTNTLHKMLEVD
tara:strand:+ start:703 stop:861 length:159 start_codon:yes stop_codon:yes gene_type:complete